jgi:AraC-like DNA-binding protein
VLLIPPNTAFSTRFTSSKNRIRKDVLEGSRITCSDDLAKLEEQKKFDHFFIHFNLGFQYDNIKPSIYKYRVDSNVLNQLKLLKKSLVAEYEYINLKVTATVQSLILGFIALIPQSDVVIENYDSRVVKVLNFIDRNFHLNLSNKALSDLVAMSPNSLLRLFKAKTGQPIHSYLQKKRIEEAIAQIHHTDRSIDEIASACGFCDRYHFSKVFRKQLNISPAYYRKQLTMK